MPTSVPASSPTIILDAGPLIAAVNLAEPTTHRWILEQFAALRGGFIVTSAAVAEATHLLGNAPAALAALRGLVGRMTVEDPAPVDVLVEMAHWEPRMDYADACAVLLARRHKGAVVLTTDHRDFSIYKVPFISPRGEFRRRSDGALGMKAAVVIDTAKPPAARKSRPSRRSDLPAPRANADDLLRALDDGSFAKATAGIDLAKVEAVVKGRRSRLDLRPY